MGFFTMNERKTLEKAKKYYETGRYRSALIVLQKLIALDDEVPESNEACFLLGDMYLEGKGVPKDAKQAFLYYSLGAKEQHPECMGRLAGLFMSGEGTKQNFGEGIKWAQRAVRKGFMPPKVALGQFYDSFVKDQEVAWESIIESVRDAFEKGVEGEEDEFYPYVIWCWLAAEEGFSEAQYLLGVLYQTGIRLGVYYDIEEALFWYEKAAEQKNAKAAFQIAEICEKRLIDSDKEVYLNSDLEPIEAWYRKAEALGCEEAKERLFYPILLKKIYKDITEGCIGSEQEAMLLAVIRAYRRGEMKNYSRLMASATAYSVGFDDYNKAMRKRYREEE